MEVEGVYRGGVCGGGINESGMTYVLFSPTNKEDIPAPQRSPI